MDTSARINEQAQQAIEETKQRLRRAGKYTDWTYPTTSTVILHIKHQSDLYEKLTQQK